MTKFFLTVYDYFASRRGLLFGLSACLAVVFAVAALHIGFKEDIARFLPENKDNKRINDAYQYVATSNTVTVYCEVKDQISNGIRATDALAARLERLQTDGAVKSIFYSVNPEEMLEISSFIIKNMPYFLEEEDYRRINSLLTREAIAQQIENDRNMLSSAAGIIVRNNILLDPLQLSAPLMAKLQEFKAGGNYQIIDDHLFTNDGEALMFIDCAFSASETDRNAAFTDSLKKYLTEIETEYNDVKFSYFGASEIAVSNADRIKSDTALSMTLAMILIFCLLIYSFRRAGRILLILVSTVFGALFALAALFFLRGEVSIIAIGISSIMFGIAINYPLHFIEHHRHTGNSRHVIKDIIQPLTIGNITTVGAFISLLFVGSAAMTDLGLFASLLLVGTILFVLIFLPHLLKNNQHADIQCDNSLFGRFAQKPFEQNRYIILTVIALTIAACFFAGDTRFETDMQKINYMTENQRVSFDKMMNLLNNNRHLMYYVTEGETLDDALENNEDNMLKVRELTADKIDRYGGVSVFYPSQQKQKERIDRWNGFWNEHRDGVMQYLREEAHHKGFKDNAFANFQAMLEHQYQPVDMSYFDIIKSSLAKNYLNVKDDKYLIINMLYTDRDSAEVIEQTLNAVSPTGIAFDAGSITRRMVGSLSDGFNNVLYICGLIVLVFLIITLGRIELSLIAFIPLALSWLLILGLMNILDMRFNIVNIILATFIFGQGDDYTIFMTEGLMYEYTYRRRMLASYKKAILTSAIIMFVGMGMLITARHPALRSLAEVTITGMISVVVMSFVFPSLLYRFLTLKKGKPRTYPLTLRNLSAMVYSFFIFLIISLLTTVIGSLMFAFGKATEKKKLYYHILIQKVIKFLLYRIPFVKTNLRNLADENFERPGIIICNHQSHLDLACVMMLTPKLIILTNDWVWNSPFYGKLIKYADYYPVSKGIENAVERLRGAVERGYSIVVFPEGTRSPDCRIGRFHRGAFYLAEKLNVDIIPVFIHGVGHVLPKPDFLLRKGTIDIRIMPRITPDDERFTSNYSQRSLEVRHYYSEEYAKICRELETPDYYADSVIHNYIYKGAKIERSVRRNMRRSGNFAADIAAMPEYGDYTLRNTGYGEFALLAALVRKKLHITAIEPDDDVRTIAENCALKPDNLVFTDRIIHLSETDSTNLYLQQLCETETLPSDTVVVADYQTSGRGQAGNSWESAEGKNLIFSTLYRPTNLPANRLFAISEITALSVKNTLKKYINADITVKWSNDIYVGDKKICGILIENQIVNDTATCSHRIGRSVIGIGININQNVFSENLPNPVSLSQLTGTNHDLEDILQTFLQMFDSYCKRLDVQQYDSIHSEYLASLYRREGFHPYSDANGRFEAAIHDVEPTG
ncbi:MAG: biotin--[acetyl-CoA-carboxylase] ligase, partial [Tannerella sp.]|nr:biotin--[acetyl-CoA-carboxylase] ligase [Tannerella sp.]